MVCFQPPVFSTADHLATWRTKAPEFSIQIGQLLLAKFPHGLRGTKKNQRLETDYGLYYYSRSKPHFNWFLIITRHRNREKFDVYFTFLRRNSSISLVLFFFFFLSWITDDCSNFQWHRSTYNSSSKQKRKRKENGYWIEELSLQVTFISRGIFLWQ